MLHVGETHEGALEAKTHLQRASGLLWTYSRTKLFKHWSHIWRQTACAVGFYKINLFICLVVSEPSETSCWKCWKVTSCQQRTQQRNAEHHLDIKQHSCYLESSSAVCDVDIIWHIRPELHMHNNTLCWQQSHQQSVYKKCLKNKLDSYSLDELVLKLRCSFGLCGCSNL